MTAILLGLNQVLYQGGTGGFVFFWFSVAMIGVSAFFLYQVSYNYFMMKEKQLSEEAGLNQ